MTSNRFSARIARLQDNPAASAWDVHGRARSLAAQGRDVIFLSVGDPDFDTPPAIVDAAVASLRAGRTKYAPVRGEPALRQAIAQWHAQRSGVAVQANQVLVTPGAQNALYNVLQAIVGHGDDVLVPEPYYATYPGVLAAAGAVLHGVVTAGADGHAVRADAIAAALTPRTRAVVINSPSNPAGAIVDREALAAIAALCRAHDLWLVADEVYADFVFEGRHASLFDVAGGYDRAVVVGSLSKRLAMSGWRIGWCVGAVDLIDAIATIAAPQLFASPQFIQDAAAFALSAPRPEIDAMRAAYRERAAFVVDAVARIDGLCCVAPAGGMFVLIDVSDVAASGRDFADRLLDAHGVAVVPGYGFGPSVAGHVRVSLTQPVAVLRDAFERIAAFTAACRSRPAPAHTLD